MRWRPIVLLFGALLAWSRPALAASLLEQLEQEQQALFERVAPSVVFVATRDGFGSGFFVDREGLILTSAHVVDDDKTVDVILHDGRRLPGRVVELAKSDFDLALVKAQVSASVPLEFAPDAPRIGTWVAAIGHGLGGAWTYTSGMISNIYPLGRERPVFQTQIPVNPGNSGGPVFDRHGRVLGVVTASVTSASNMNFAIRVGKACDVLAAAAKLCRRLILRGPPGVPLFLDGKAVGNGPQLTIPITPGVHEAFVVIGGQMRKQRFTYPQQDSVDLTR
jgi:S1-C subfamily serine protease